MDSALCDELLQDIFHRLPPQSFPTITLVSKKWCRLLRNSTTFLSLRLSATTTTNSFSAFLTQHPHLSSLSLSVIANPGSGYSSDHLLISLTSCPNLRHLRLVTPPVSDFSLYSLSSYCPHLSSLTLFVARPLSFRWLEPFRHTLKDLSIYVTGNSTRSSYHIDGSLDAELNLECLSLSGIGVSDHALKSLWNNCKKIKKLRLKSCEGIGDEDSFSGFINCSNGLQEVELRTSRSIADGVLLKLAESSISLTSLLVYDGGSKEGLIQFIRQTNCNLKNLDLRLPLDLENSHLLALAEKCKSLVSLRLQSCCLVTGEGLKALGRARSEVLEELALVNCDVVEREPGLLAALGQSLKRLKKLDLSYNEMLLDKEFMSMLVSCDCLKELNLRGCNRLSSAVLVSMTKSCKQLQSLDITYCGGMKAEAVELFVSSCPWLRRVEVEQSKIPDVAKFLVGK